MVAQKRGRGGKAQAAKAKAATAPAEEVAPEVEAPETETMEAAEDNNGEAEQPADETMAEEEQAESTEPAQDATASEPAPEVKAEEKVEAGKILVENLPSSYLFDYQDKLKELFAQYGEVTTVKRGPIIVTELTTTPTLSAIVEFKNKESVEKALASDGTDLDGHRMSVAVECCQDRTVLVGVPYEATIDYVRLLFSECGEITQILEFSKTKYKILRVTFADKECVERAQRLDRELRINGFLVTVARYRSDDDAKQQSQSKNKRNYNQINQNRNANNNGNSTASSPQQPRTNNYRGRGGPPPQPFNARGNFRGGRGRGGFAARGGGAFPRGGFAGGPNSYMPYMAPRPNYF